MAVSQCKTQDLTTWNTPAFFIEKAVQAGTVRSGLALRRLRGLIRLISFLPALAASHRSTARCALTQNSGELPNSLASRNAISGLTPRRSRRFMDRLTGHANCFGQSRRIQIVIRQKIFAEHLSGVGRVALHAIVRNAHKSTLSVIVTNFDVKYMAIGKSKTYPPSVIALKSSVALFDHRPAHAIGSRVDFSDRPVALRFRYSSRAARLPMSGGRSLVLPVA